MLEHNTEITRPHVALDTIRLTSSDGGVVPLTFSIQKIEQRFLRRFPSTIWISSR
ncbi:hypothetical protein ACLB1E_18190 [Escherichia coli]